LLFLGKYWGTLWKSIGTLRELDVNIMGIFWELGEFGENTLIIQSSKNQKSILGSSSRISRESSLA
jgi:hypothetical protein